MRLKSIKLAGFKSFVEPTKVAFKHQMTAIVGPNGCGKSNIIDAVRWVLGESSAKHLRGDSITDVIFNGAASRAPVGQASVELIFENTAGVLSGSLADRNQVSVRRLVNRDGQNSYFLNGSKCRKKDVTELFLGTGLGPRSYAIIEQGTISKLIESKPLELRFFLEEAAGISKYKEKRRETETRIRHTRENLSRLDDLRHELEHHIDSLHQQAEAAKRYKTLKAEERKLKGELTYHRWQKFDNQAKQCALDIKAFEEQFANFDLQNKDFELGIFTQKQQQQLLNEEIQALREKHIELNNQLIRHEQKLAFDNEQQERLKADINRYTAQEKEVSEALKQSREQLSVQNELLLSLTPEKEEKAKALAAATDEQSVNNKELSDIQRKIKQQQENDRAFQEKRLTLNNQYVQLNSEIKLLAIQQAEYQAQLEQLLKTKLPDVETDHKNLAQLDESLSLLVSEEQRLTRSLTEANQSITQISNDFISLTTEIKMLETRLVELTELLKSQDAWQEQLCSALAIEGESTLGAVHQVIDVDKEWRQAVFTVLSSQLTDVVVSKKPNLASLEQYAISFADDGKVAKTDERTLASKLKGSEWLRHSLDHVYVADSQKEAEKLLLSLASHQSVVTKDGLWLGHTFARKGLFENDSAALLKRYDEQNDLVATVEQKQKLLHDVSAKKETLTISIEALDEQINEIQIKKEELLDKVESLKSSLVEKQKQHAFHNEKQQSLASQLSNTETQLSAKQESLSTIKGDIETLESGEHDGSGVSLALASQQALIEKGQKLAEQLQRVQAESHQVNLSFEQVKNAKSQAGSDVDRQIASLSQINNHIESVNKQLTRLASPEESKEDKLSTLLSTFNSSESELKKVEHKLAQVTEKVSELEAARAKARQKNEFVKDRYNKKQIELESAKLKAENFNEQLVELGQSITEIKAKLPERFNETQWQAHLVKLAKDIALLGAINLAAIDQYEKELARKNYLDQQNQDLNLALTRLESAIAKIDKESRAKFKATFEQVNHDLQKLFPKVFGGGSAYLDLTDDDLLEAGVSIMARPPGKKNSTIHLLSGGEKALTALSLVFSIFRLNPAPFCMLDEVDAPLDDANVERFCKLVNEMSQSVQFVYISHNKIAMEMASHLTGVTMFEPGVSRMVAVDIDEAIAMAEVS